MSFTLSTTCWESREERRGGQAVDRGTDQHCNRITYTRTIHSMDRTLFFRQCVEICTESQEETPATGTINRPRKSKAYNLSSSEIYTKTKSVHSALVSLEEFLQTIRPQYLLANSKQLSEEQKVVIDSEIKLKLQHLTNRIKNLQDVDAKLHSLSADSEALTVALREVGFTNIINESNGKEGKSWNSLQMLTRNIISMGDYSEYMTIKNETLRTIFSNVYKSLAMQLQRVLLMWNEMHDKRVERLVQLKKSTLTTTSTTSTAATTTATTTPFSNNNVTGMNMFKLNDNSISSTTSFDNDHEGRYISDDYETMQTQIPAQELQQLQEEQASLLEKLKAETLDTVTQIESSMMDVASMVREIGVQLSMQNENITILDSQKDEILGNVKSGNTVLIKANESNARRNRVFAWMIFFAAMLLLLIDYIL